MSRRYMIIPTLLLGTSLCASPYTFFNPDFFAEKGKMLHLEGDFSWVAPAKFTTDDVYGSKLRYREGNGSAYLTGFLNEENSLTLQVGANYIDLGWHSNPIFTKDVYTYGLTSLTWVSKSVDKWRWAITGGVAVDAITFNFGQTGVYYTMLWGRYQAHKNVGANLGFYAYYGARNGYVLPILGFDWQIAPRWQLNAVFPIDASLTFHFAKNWMTSILATSYGGPYRFPRQIHGGTGDYYDGIFKIFSTAIEWDLSFAVEKIVKIGGGAGWNFGGWMQVSDKYNHNKQYYDFNGAPYARVYATLSI